MSFQPLPAVTRLSLSTNHSRFLRKLAEELDVLSLALFRDRGILIDQFGRDDAISITAFPILCLPTVLSAN